MDLYDEIENVKNVGAQRKTALNKLNIFTVLDLIEYFPRDYDDRSKIKNINELILDEVNTFKGVVSNIPEIIKTKSMSITKAKISDSTGIIEAVWFNQPYLKNTFKLNTEFIFTGKVVKKYSKLQAESPDFEIISGNELLSNGRIVPIYSLTAKLSQKVIRSLINSVINDIVHQIEDFLPDDVINEYNLCSRKYAVKNIHFPESSKAFFSSRKRLVFEELFLMQMKLLQIKGIVKGSENGFPLKDIDTSEIENKLAFKLTNAQKKVVSEFINDITGKSVMNRLVQGDVGSGKTAVALICVYIMAKNGYQSAVMAPTDVLANQHFLYFKNILEDLDIKCVFLGGNLTKKEKRRVYDAIETGFAKVVIGTHAIIEGGVNFDNLALAITDEQHRFGVRQRDILTKKGTCPHVLVMTATPIPRTLALILYGDLDISIIDSLPPGRQKIDTFAVTDAYRKRMYGFMKKLIDSGRQAYIICPMIEENEKIRANSVISYTEKIKKDDFEGYRVECIHGKMKSDEKNYIMNEFSNGNIDILVATTVIEVGIDVPNAVVMVIENAERFGLSQLHQLRGRVGRGKEKSYCILVSNSNSDVSRKRLKVMTNSSDGFEISGKDLELRGPGDFFGTRQHGLPEMKIANLYKDVDILKLVQKAALKLYSDDPNLEKTENKKLKIEIERLFTDIQGVL